MAATIEARIAKPTVERGIHAMENRSNSGLAQPRRPRTRRQLVSNALRQAARLGAGFGYTGHRIGMVFGRSLADATMLRKLADAEPYGFCLADLLHDVLDLPAGERTDEERMRVALFCGICDQYDMIVRWAYECGAFHFKAGTGNESDIMSRATQQAKQLRAELAAAA